MPYSFDWVCKDVVKKLQGKDLCPVKRLSDATKFRQFEILQKTAQSLFWKTEDIPVGYSLLQILEPNFPVPDPEVSAPIPLKCTVSQKLKGNLGVNAIAEGSVSAEFAHSSGYDIEVQCTSIPASKLEILQNRKLVEKEPSFIKDCRIGRKDLYVVTEAFEVTRGTVLEDSSSVSLLGKVLTPQFAKVQAQGDWHRETKDSVPILKGAVVAYKKKQLVIENDTCAILLSAKAKKKTLLGTLRMQPRFLGHPQYFQPKTCALETEIRPHSRRQLDWELSCISPIGRLDEPLPNDFQHLQNEISEKTGLLAMLSKDVQDAVFSSLLPMLGDRDTLYDLMIMLELGQLGHMDGPGGVILDELRKDSWNVLKDLILYLLHALMVLSDTQLSLLAQSVEKQFLLQQRQLVKSILQANFKYPWNIPFTLQPQLLAPLQGEGLAITYGLLSECGLQMELNNPRSTWDLEAKMPMSALYGSLSFLQQLVEA
ncbi:gasdermin-C-like [Mesocricetus auratus]|uniref:Gasdermin-C-like n=1 Tax=Mesocricetus auratus TaxID=10036 RepID=A0ABM2W637_MESAU|nr:gasdermin-C-like [Mesocricetus auratus]